MCEMLRNNQTATWLPNKQVYDVKSAVQAGNDWTPTVDKNDYKTAVDKKFCERVDYNDYATTLVVQNYVIDLVLW